MDTLIDDARLEQIIKFLNSLEINSKRFIKIINEKDKLILHTFNEALTHSSANKIVNYEKLEFFGDAVLRLSASDFIERTYSNMSVGIRSELRSQIVSDEWLTELGKKIFIEKVIIKGPKAMGDENSKDTIIAETSEALIGAIYKCFNSINEDFMLVNKPNTYVAGEMLDWEAPTGGYLLQACISNGAFVANNIINKKRQNK